jgi:hypothetical protein
MNKLNQSPADLYKEKFLLEGYLRTHKKGSEGYDEEKYRQACVDLRDVNRLGFHRLHSDEVTDIENASYQNAR